MQHLIHPTLPDKAIPTKKEKRGKNRNRVKYVTVTGNKTAVSRSDPGSFLLILFGHLNDQKSIIIIFCLNRKEKKNPPPAVNTKNQREGRKEEREGKGGTPAQSISSAHNTSNSSPNFFPFVQK